MLAVIEGKQRAGKTYYCVTLIIEYLQNSKRPIYANLPLNPDILCDYACGGKIRHPGLYEGYLKRIHLFKSFKGRRKRLEYKIFKSKNPDYVKAHKAAKKSNQDALIVDQELIKTFWRIVRANSIIFLDELYQWFSSADFRDASEVRKELLTYTRQHGHFKDDMYLVSHNKSDLDSHIRRGIQRLYVIENSKYKNISDRFLLKGLKWPIQFFIISAYEYGDRTHSDRYFRASKGIIFKCYESFSAAETLKKQHVDEDAKSTDTHIDQKANIINFLKQSYVFIFIILFLGVGAVYLYHFMMENVLKSKVSMGNNIKKEVKTDIKLNDFYKVVFTSPKTIVFDDGYKLNKGDDIYGLKVIAFKNDYCVLSDGKRTYNVSYSGLRIREQKSGHNDDAGSAAGQQQRVEQAS